jgi:putative hydrolase of the HAD superfamily
LIVDSAASVGRTAVVFDFGGVIITPITNQVGVLAARHAVSTTTMLEVLLGPHASGDHPWHRAERGELTVAGIQELLGPWADDAELTLVGDEIDAIQAPGMYEVIDPMVERIARLHASGIATALLTNTFAEFRPTLETILDLSMFDQVIESYDVGARKPEPAIYEITRSRLGVEHAEIVYLDDFVQNLDAARSLGWTAIEVTDPLAAIAELDELLEPRTGQK